MHAMSDSMKLGYWPPTVMDHNVRPTAATATKLAPMNCQLLICICCVCVCSQCSSATHMPHPGIDERPQISTTATVALSSCLIPV
jgi:hypothetical protein